MHESSLVAELIEKIDRIARENAAQTVCAIEISVGALAGIGLDHLREHFNAAARGTAAEGAELRLTISDDPMSTGLVLESVELER